MCGGGEDARGEGEVGDGEQAGPDAGEDEEVDLRLRGRVGLGVEP